MVIKTIGVHNIAPLELRLCYSLLYPALADRAIDFAPLELIYTQPAASSNGAV